MDHTDFTRRLRGLRRDGVRVLESGVPTEDLVHRWRDPSPHARAVFAAVMSLPSSEVEQLVAEQDLQYLLVSTFAIEGDEQERDAMLVGLSARAPLTVGRYLQRAAVLPEGRAHRFDAARTWWSKVSFYSFRLPTEMHGAVVWAVGDTRAALGGVRSSDADTLRADLDRLGCLDSPCVKVGQRLSLMGDAYISRDDASVAGAAADLRDLMDTQGHALLPLIPWLLASGDRHEISFLAEFAVVVPEAFRTLHALSTDPMSPAHLRTRGLTDILTLGARSTSGDLARWASDTSTFLVPAKLSAPSSIWTDDSSLENAIRNAATGAVEALRTEGMSKEDQITGSLVTLLHERLEPVARRSAARADHQGLDLTYVTTPSSALSGKGGEVANGTDLAILVSVNVPGVLATTKAHLVQVKRPPITARKSTPPRWKIETAQLRKILEHDRSATYWLVSERPNERVLCVPASYLEARAHAREHNRNYGEDGDELSLKYDNSLSSAAIPLGQLMVDLIIGMWVGTSAPEAVAIAKSQDAVYRPQYLIQIGIGSAERDN